MIGIVLILILVAAGGAFWWWFVSLSLPLIIHSSDRRHSPRVVGRNEEPLKKPLPRRRNPNLRNPRSLLARNQQRTTMVRQIKMKKLLSVTRVPPARNRRDRRKERVRVRRITLRMRTATMDGRRREQMMERTGMTAMRTMNTRRNRNRRRRSRAPSTIISY